MHRSDPPADPYRCASRGCPFLIRRGDYCPQHADETKPFHAAGELGVWGSKALRDAADDPRVGEKTTADEGGPAALRPCRVCGTLIAVPGGRGRPPAYCDPCRVAVRREKGAEYARESRAARRDAS
jgi:hypothetical protein